MSVKGKGYSFGGQNRQTLFVSFPHSFKNHSYDGESVKCFRKSSKSLCSVCAWQFRKAMSAVLAVLIQGNECLLPRFRHQPASPAHNIVSRDTTWNFKNMQKKSRNLPPGWKNHNFLLMEGIWDMCLCLCLNIVFLLPASWGNYTRCMDSVGK